MKKILLWLYGDRHYSAWLFLGVLGWIIMGLIDAIFNVSSTMTNDLFWATFILVFISPSLLFYTWGSSFIVRVRRNSKYVLVERDWNDRVIAHGTYFWRRPRHTYKKVPKHIDGCITFGLPVPAGRWAMNVTFDIHVEPRDLVNDDPLTYYAIIADQWDGVPFHVHLRHHLYKKAMEVKDQLFTIAFGSGSDMEKDQQILKLVAIEHSYNKVAKITIGVQREVRLILLSA